MSNECRCFLAQGGFTRSCNCSGLNGKATGARPDVELVELANHTNQALSFPYFWNGNRWCLTLSPFSRQQVSARQWLSMRRYSRREVAELLAYGRLTAAEVTT